MGHTNIGLAVGWDGEKIVKREHTCCDRWGREGVCSKDASFASRQIMRGFDGCNPKEISMFRFTYRCFSRIFGPEFTLYVLKLTFKCEFPNANNWGSDVTEQSDFCSGILMYQKRYIGEKRRVLGDGGTKPKEKWSFSFKCSTDLTASLRHGKREHSDANSDRNVGESSIVQRR